MPFQLELVSASVGFGAGLIIGFISGWLVGRKRPRGGSVTINSVTLGGMMGASVNVSVEYDSRDNLVDLWSKVYPNNPGTPPSDPAGLGAKQFPVTGPSVFTTDLLVDQRIGYVVVWAHLKPKNMMPMYYAPSKPKQYP